MVAEIRMLEIHKGIKFISTKVKQYYRWYYVTEPEVTTISQKGQVVIPQSLRSKLGLSPRTKLIVYGYGDTIIMKKLELPDVKSELEALWKEMDKKLAGKRRPTEKEILEEIQRYRKEKRKQ